MGSDEQERDAHLRFGNGGWIAFRDEGMPSPVFVRVVDQDGRLTPVDLFIADDAGLNTDALRAVPLGRIESWVNEPPVARAIRYRLNMPGPLLRTAVSHYATSYGSSAKHWVARMMRSQLKGDTERRVEPRADAWEWSVDAPSGPTPSAELEVPGGRPYPDQFYAQVAAVYSALARHGAPPAKTLAAANGVPATTAHRWIREARSRGYLPPARQGKAG
jgi:hypothetical protein